MIPIVINDSLLIRLFSRFKVNENGCWLWSGCTSWGYGIINGQTKEFRKRTLKAHRVAYTALNGPIPDGLTIDHLCFTRNCINPSHMEPVTLEENCTRSNIWLKRTHCKRGHLLVPNLKVGARCCYPCQLIGNKNYSLRKKLKASSLF